MSGYSGATQLLAPKLKMILEKCRDGQSGAVINEYLEIYEFSKENPDSVSLKKLLEAIKENYLHGILPENVSGKLVDKDKTLETTICIVTPAYNSADTIDETIRSVLNQEGDFALRYHVQDGGSTDGTIDILEHWRKRLNSGMFGQANRNIIFTYQSELDSGMYDALVKGFRVALASGVRDKSWMGWINSDDQFDSGAFAYLADIDNSQKSTLINWITGMQSVRKENGERETYRVPITSDLISKGLCDGKHWWYVQQEGTFWRKMLWEECNAEDILIQHKFAGDWRLWFEFSKKRVLYQALRPLGIFNIRKGQISQTSLDEYNQEIDGIVSMSKRTRRLEEFKGQSVRAIEVIRVDSSREIIISARPVGIEAEKAFMTNNSSAKYVSQSSCNVENKIDPYFLRTYGVSESSKKEKLGIIVFGHTRVSHIEAVLRSLVNQGAAKITNVWIDGHQGKQALIEKTQKVADVATKYGVGKVVRHNGQLGFRKILIQGLIDMANRYESVIVLEDDCYPTPDAVRIFSEDLKAIADDPSTFSVYGHYFLTPSEGDYITRFQGWGWATTSAKLRPILHQLIDCYSMPEEQFLEFVTLTMTDEIKSIIDVTPPRNPSVCLERFFAWDETTALLTGLMGLKHKKASKRIVYNIGMDEGEHFKDKPVFRAPPFNMLTLSEVLKIDSLQES